MGVHDGHRQRMIRKFLEEGVDGMQPHEILEMLLFYAIPRRNTNEIGHRLIETFGSFTAVLDAPYEELLKVEGIGPNAAALLKMIPQFARAYVSGGDKPVILNSIQDAAEYILPKYIGRTKETVFLLCLDNKNKVNACVLVTEGSVNSAEVNTRRIAELGMKYNASAVILAHNHPSGSALPSRDDLDTTRRLLQFCRQLNMPLLDHLVVSDGDYVSMAQSGMLASMMQDFR